MLEARRLNFLVVRKSYFELVLAQGCKSQNRYNSFDRLFTLFFCCDGGKRKIVHEILKMRLGILTRYAIPVIN